VVQHLQHLPLTSESDAELVNNPLQCRLLGGFSPKAAGAPLEGRSRDETQRIAANIAKAAGAAAQGRSKPLRLVVAPCLRLQARQ
jgi:hypothetical protein